MTCKKWVYACIGQGCNWIYLYIPVLYILGTYTVKHLLYFESGFACLVTPTVLCCTLLAYFTSCDLPLACLLNTQTTKEGLATSQTPQPQVNLVDIAAPPSIISCWVGTTILEAWILVLVEHVRDCWSRVSSKKKGDKGDPAHHVCCRNQIETGDAGWFIQLGHSRAASQCAQRNLEVKHADLNDLYLYILVCHWSRYIYLY